MTNRRAMMAGVVISVVMTAAAATIGAASPTRRTVLTFNSPVGLPGVTLGPGSYSFEVVTRAGGTVVLVENKQGSVFMNFTETVERPADIASDVTVRFGETAAGKVPPIIEWYPSGEKIGQRFIYKTH